MTHDEVIALNRRWIARLERIKARHTIASHVLFETDLLMAIVSWVLRDGITLTPETAQEFMEAKLRELE